MTWQQALHDYQDGILTPRGLVYCYFVVHLRPGTEMRVDVETLCALLTVHEATYYRAIGALKQRGRLNIRRGQMTVGVPEIHPRPAQSQMSEPNSQICESELQICESESQVCESESQSCENANSGNVLPGKGSRSAANVPTTNKEIFKTNKPLVPTTHPVGCSIDREDSGALSQGVVSDSVVSQNSILEELSALITEAGMATNKTLQSTLVELIQHRDPAAARQAVENALSALQEQQRRRKIRNPGGFLRAALQRGFTANQAKREARIQRQKQPPDLVQVSVAIDQALANGDRDFALAKLQALWHEGWHEEMKELVAFFRTDWPFVITEEGIRHADG
jgi:hypothetical protein